MLFLFLFPPTGHCKPRWQQYVEDHPLSSSAYSCEYFSGSQGMHSGSESFYKPFQIWCELYLYRKRAFTVKYGYSVRFQEWSYLTGAFTSWKCAQTNPSNRQTPSGMLRNTSRISLIVSIATLTSFKSFCRFLSYQILCIFVNVFTFFSRENILIS